MQGNVFVSVQPKRPVAPPPSASAVKEVGVKPTKSPKTRPDRPLPIPPPGVHTLTPSTHYTHPQIDIKAFGFLDIHSLEQRFAKSDTVVPRLRQSEDNLVM